MPRNLTPKFLQHIRVDMRDDYHTGLLTLSHPNMVGPLYLCCDSAKITSNGIDYQPFPFFMNFFTDDGKPVRTDLAIQNTSASIGRLVKELKGAITVRIQLILRQYPDSIILDMDHLLLKVITVDNTAIKGTLIFKNYSTLPWPSMLATKALLPGLWR